jgi:hypothetical protein
LKPQEFFVSRNDTTFSAEERDPQTPGKPPSIDPLNMNTKLPSLYSPKTPEDITGSHPV